MVGIDNTSRAIRALKAIAKELTSPKGLELIASRMSLSYVDTENPRKSAEGGIRILIADGYLVNGRRSADGKAELYSVNTEKLSRYKGPSKSLV